MNKHQIQEKIIDLGLSPQEADIYLCLIENGALTPLELSRETNLNRTTIYRIIEQLSAKKLIQESVKDGGKKYKASSLDNIELFIQEQEEIIQQKKEIATELTSLLQGFNKSSENEYEVTHYHGQDGLQQMLWNELKSSEVLVFGYKTINLYVGEKFGDKHRGESVKRGVSYREIVNSGVGDYLLDLEYNKADGWDKMHQLRFISKDIFEIKNGIQIYDNTVEIANYVDEDLTGIEIKNKNLANMMRQMFEYFWSIAEKRRS